jgi:N-methylhydantoinase A
VTDAALVLGYIGESTALGGELRLDADAAREALSRLADEAGLSDAAAAARGVYRVANANMSRAIRAVTVERGHDPRTFGLVAFGGAGPMHAAALAEGLDVETVVVPRACGVLSALGLLGADEKHDASRTRRRLADDVDADEAEAVFADLETDVLEDVSDPAAATVERAADLRYHGQSFELTVPAGEPFSASAAVDRFHEAHDRTYGYRMDEPVELVTLRTTAVVERHAPATRYAAAGDPERGTRRADFDGESHETPVYDREALAVGADVAGPAVLEQAESTVVVPPAWTGRVRNDGTLVLTADATEGAT